MQLLIEVPDRLLELGRVLAECSGKILQTLQPVHNEYKIPGNSKLLDLEQLKGKVLTLVEGNLQHFVNEKPLVVYEPGDLLLLERVAGHGSDIRSDFAVIVQEIDYHELLDQLAGRQELFHSFCEFLISRQQFYLELSASLIREELHFEPAFRTFQPGEVIIEQGNTDSVVYTMTEGRAEVLVDGVRVGEVLADEIFGAIAALTQTPRTARVVALEPSMVLSLPGEKFIELIRSRPATVNKLVSDMARTIVDLNQRVVQKQSSSGL